MKRAAVQSQFEPLNMHVMLVDDELVIRRLGERLLKMLGCTFVLLTDGSEIDGALDASPRPFEAILLDIVMRTDGGQTCEMLRKKLHVRLQRFCSRLTVATTCGAVRCAVVLHRAVCVRCCM